MNGVPSSKRAATLALAIAVLGIAGCAYTPSRPPYVGVFTGEFVDGRPLYRFPSIEVVGSRKSVSRDSSPSDGS
jgi:hypothetical protein